MDIEKQPVVELYDMVGIGFGPANLALAAALDEHRGAAGMRTLFLEQKPSFAWHPHMLLSDTVMQISFLKDLVTQRNPESRYTFINFLKARGRLASFINLRTFYPTRLEFNDYMAWVAQQLHRHVRYGCSVSHIGTEGKAPHQLARISYRCEATGTQREVLARNIVVGIGGQPHIPFAIDACTPGEHVWHSSRYLDKIAEIGLRPRHRFVVIGRGQSAAEIANDLYGRFPDASVTCMFRGYSLKPSDSSAFVNGVFDADFVDELHGASAPFRKKLIDEHRDTNYAVIDEPLISKLYGHQYNELVSGKKRLHFHNFATVTRIVDGPQGAKIFLVDGRSNLSEMVEADTVVMATGYQYANPPALLGALTQHVHLNEAQRPEVSRNYRVRMKSSAAFGLFLQGCNEDTHGLGDTLLSNLSIRAADIVGELLASPAAAHCGAGREQPSVAV